MAAEPRPDSYKLLARLQVLAGVGCFAIFFYACRFWASGDVVRIATVGLLIAGAGLLTGFLAGFIFGVPRVVAGDSTHGVQANDNLIEISNWLTKILVGVGLVELGTIPGRLWSLAAHLESGLRPAQCTGTVTCADLATSAQATGLAIIIFYFALGFLLGYIWTRIYFERDLGAKVEKLKLANIRLELEKMNAETARKAADLILRAETSLNSGQLNEAMQAVQDLLAKDPRDGKAVLTKGRVLKRQAMEAKDPEIRNTLLQQALDSATTAIELLPGVAAPIYNRACYETLLHLDKRDILRDLAEAFRLDPALRITAVEDDDLKPLREDPDFIALTSAGEPPSDLETDAGIE